LVQFNQRHYVISKQEFKMLQIFNYQGANFVLKYTYNEECWQ